MIQVGDRVQLTEITGIEAYSSPGGSYEVMEIHESGMAYVANNGSSFWVPRSQLKKKEEDK